MTVLKNEKEFLKRFILNYQLIENEEMLDIEVEDFFQIDSNVATNINETTNVDDHIYMNELVMDLLLEKIIVNKEGLNE